MPSGELEEEEVAQEEEIVAFANEESVSRVSKDVMEPMPNKALANIKEKEEHDINKFLKRPRIVAEVNWDDTDLVDATLATVDMPGAILTTNMPACKLSDFRFFRCTTVFRFLINANQFATGRLQCWSEPFPGQRGLFAPRPNLTCHSGYPCVYIDAGKSTTVEFRVPYVSYSFAHDLHNMTPGSWARMTLNVMNRLKDNSGSPNCDITIYMWCEDIVLSVPTVNHITAVPAPLFKKGVLSEKREKGEPLKTKKWNGRVQMNEGGDLAEKGDISSVLSSVSSVSSVVADLGLGPVSEIANAVAWTSDIASEAASLFGFSKPENMEPLKSMVQMPASCMTNVNAVDHSNVLGADVRNSLDIDQTLFGAKNDEMDISFICSKENFLETILWNSGYNKGEVIGSWMVTPGLCADTANGDYVQCTQMSYVASMFKYWRGSIKYKFSIVGNKFYSGRLCFVFLSGHQSVPATVTSTDFEGCPQVTCDFKEGGECCLEIPYVLNYPYLRNNIMSRSSNAPFAYSTSLSFSSGLLIAFVLNPLRHPTSVNSELDINVFISGGKDLEFAVPQFGLGIPFYNAIPAPLKKTASGRVQSGSKPTGSVKSAVKKPANLHFSPFKTEKGAPKGSAPGDVFMRSKPDGASVKAPPSKPGGAKGSPKPKPDKEDMKMQNEAGKPNPARKVLSKVPATTTLNAACSIGEKIINLRVLTRMFSIAHLASDTGDSIHVDPAFMGNGGSFTTRQQYIAALFAFYRGGFRVKFFPTNSNVDYPLFGVYTENRVGAPADIVFGAIPTVDQVGFLYVQNLNVNPVLEISMPYYRGYACSLVTSAATSDARNRAIITPFGATWITLEGLVLTAGGDDFSFGYLVGAPVLQAYS